MPPATNSVLIWADPSVVPALEQTAASHRASTGIEVLVQPMGLDEVRERLPELAPQGQGPDLFVGQSDWVGELADNGLLAPLDLTAQAARFRPVSVAAFTYEQRQYGVPFGTENIALLRNTDLAPKAPETVEAMAASGLRLVESDRVEIPIGLPIGPHGDAYHWYPLYSASGGYLFAQDVDGSYSTDSLGVGEAGSIRAAEELAELAEDGAIDPELTAGDATTAFAEGRTPYLIAGPWAVEPAESAGVPVTVEPIPGFAATTRSLSQSLVTAHGLMLSAFSRNAELAREYLTTTVMTTQAMDALFGAGGEVPAWNESYTTASTDPIVKAFGDVADASVPIPNLAVMSDVWPSLSKAELAVIRGADPERAMTRAGQDIQAAIDAG